MNQEPQPEKKWRLTLLSSVALVCGIGSFTISFLGSWAFHANWDIPSALAQGPYPRIGSIGEQLSIIGGCGAFFSLVVIFALLVYCMFKKIRGLHAHLICLGFIMSVCACFLPFITHARMGSSPARFYPFNLRALGHAIRQYSRGEESQLPQAANWCDALIRSYSHMSPRAFVNDQNDRVSEGMSEYAFNANLSGLKLPDLPNDTVLLFETKLAKNPAGGTELINAENHPLKGCFVLFGDMRVEFVRAEDFNDLRWKP